MISTESSWRRKERQVRHKRRYTQYGVFLMI